ncbi:MAG: class I SAM-dependent methyltransferase, partial [Acidobacteria bacterium]|nr:class I SAM-dependent methyltransferase [Acidobacteriota bacterium]
MRTEKISISIEEHLKELFGGIYSEPEFLDLQESASLMDEWSAGDCNPKFVGGMEEWAKEEGQIHKEDEFCCDWYHGTWQYMRLLNTVAVPRWYPFYHETLKSVLQKKPNAKVMISACADYGMLHAVHCAMKDAKAQPTIIIYDICNTPLKSSQWYAQKNNFNVTCICDNIITADIEPNSFDIVTTDEFLTVLKDPYKPLIVEKWKKILKPDGMLVTTAMIGKPTTPELRKGYAERVANLFQKYLTLSFPEHFQSGAMKEKVLKRAEHFAQFHTRHMIKDEKQV